MYSANRFVIFYSHHGSFEPLRVLSPTVLASLTSLKIVLNESSCHQPTDSMEYPPSCCFDLEHGWSDDFGMGLQVSDYKSSCLSELHPHISFVEHMEGYSCIRVLESNPVNSEMLDAS